MHLITRSNIGVALQLQERTKSNRAAVAQSFIGHADAPSAVACCGDYIISAAEAVLVWRLHAGLAADSATMTHRRPGPMPEPLPPPATAVIYAAGRQPTAVPEHQPLAGVSPQASTHSNSKDDSREVHA